MKIAVIDLGSVSARMTMWGDGGEVIYQNRIQVRLSENLALDNRLHSQAVCRTLSALKLFAEVIAKENCTCVRAVATEAVRRAENSADFIDTVFDATGIKLEILSGESESHYDFLACRDLTEGKNSLILDMGGGSFELIRADNGEFTDHICLPHGAVVTTDSIGDKNSLLPFFSHLFASLDMLKNFKCEKIIALGGSVRCASLYIIGKPSGEISSATLSDAFQKLVGMSKDELFQISAFSGRADVILAGIAPFVALSQISGAEKTVVSQNGIREGIYKECLS